MSLPLKAVDRLFTRLGATYGAAWDKALGAAPIADTKAVWCHELSGFADKLPMLAWALENLPERAPNVIEFKNLCRRAPVPNAPRLPEPKADAARVAAELAKLAPVVAAARAEPTHQKDWARRIMTRHMHGERLNPTTLRSAREALGSAREALGSAREALGEYPADLVECELARRFSMQQMIARQARQEQWDESPMKGAAR